MKESYVVEGGFDNYHEIAKELIKRHGKNVDTSHINDLAGERDTHRGLDHSEVMHHVKKILSSKEVKEGDEYDEMWKEYKGKTFKKESRMLKFNDYLKEAALSAKQKKIAAIAGDKEKIDADDLAALRAGKKPVEEASCSGNMKKEELVGNQHKLDKNKNGKLDAQDFKMLRKEEAEQLDELSKKTLGSYVKKAANAKGDNEAEHSYINRHGYVDDEDQEDNDRLERNITNREKGIKRATNKLTKEDTEQIDEISKKTLGSYVNKAAKDSRYSGQIATDFENQADKARKQSKKDSFERLHRKYLEKSWKREAGISKAVGKLTKEEVQIDEGKMKELSMDLTDMGHDEFHKKYGNPKSHYDPTNFKKPVQPGKEMDRARALAQRGMQSLSKEEVERIEGKLDHLGEGTYKPEVEKSFPASGVKTGASAPKGTTYMPKDKEKAKGKPAGSIGEEVDLEEATTRKDFQMVADLIKGHESADKRKELATHHAGIFAKQNPRFDHAKFMKAAGVNEEVEQEMTPYLKATLSFMDESKYDDYKDALRAKKATQSAYDKNFKPDTTHPHIQVVKGTQYGGENQKDDEGDEKPEAEKEKRGRGRPSGSKSGARLKGGGHEDGGIPVHNLHLPKSYK